MAEKHNCTNCKYAKANQLADPQGQPIVGKYQHNCLRFPPSAFMVQTSQGTAVGSAFPVVTEEQICSLYEPGKEGGELLIESDDVVRALKPN